MTSLLSFMVNSALVNRARFRYLSFNTCADVIRKKFVEQGIDLSL